MKKKDCLTQREEELLNILWEINEPLTSAEMAQQLESEGWTSATLFKNEKRNYDVTCGHFYGDIQSDAMYVCM